MRISLTDRQLEILELVARGLSPEQISEKLYIERHSVWKHCDRIRRQLGATTMANAVHIAHHKLACPSCE